LSSRAEQITSEVKRLVLKCRKLEADLAQSVPKKTLEETVAKMQQKIDTLNAELKRAKQYLDNAATMNERMDALGKQLDKQAEEISIQNDFIKSIAAKIDTMVPNSVYEQATQKIHELEQAFEVRSQEYASEKAEFEERISHMVPQERFQAVQAELANSVPRSFYEEEIQKIRSETVPRDQYIQMESRVSELENQLANSVPKTEFEELSQEIVSLTKSAPVLDVDFQAVATTTTTAGTTPQTVTAS
jgi:HPt (histidine-containing phosphotransfer) domain-containing protein